MNLSRQFGTDLPIIGMVHLDPLPGAPDATAPVDTIVERAVDAATTLAANGIDGIIIENFGDQPFHPADVPDHVVATMTRVGTAVHNAVSIPIGVNVLRNDATAALSIAHAIDGDMIRVNVHTGTRITDQGRLDGNAHETLRLREQLNADIDIVADIAVKHSQPMTTTPSVVERAVETATRGKDDALVVSGSATGDPVDTEQLRAVTTELSERGIDTPVLVGSGVTQDTVDSLLAIADGCIVGTALKRDGEVTNGISPDRVTQLMERVRSVRTES